VGAERVSRKGCGEKKPPPTFRKLLVGKFG
jgi:hypothetical protein